LLLLYVGVCECYVLASFGILIVLS